MFRSWFGIHAVCSFCGRKFARDPGYLLGSIYFNYGVTALLMTAGYFAAFFTAWLEGPLLLVILALFCVVFPLWFFRYARAFWIAFDEYFDPWPNEEEARDLPGRGLDGADLSAASLQGDARCRSDRFCPAQPAADA